MQGSVRKCSDYRVLYNQSQAGENKDKHVAEEVRVRCLLTIETNFCVGKFLITNDICDVFSNVEINATHKYCRATLNVSGLFLVFDNKGIIHAYTAEKDEEATAVTKKEKTAENIKQLSLEEAEEIAIDIGAEEVTVSKDVDEKSIFQVPVSPFS